MTIIEKTSYININGVEHYYEWIKTSNSVEKSKPVMVFLHGWGGSGRYWETTAKELSEKFDCLIYDLRGFGRSSLPKPDSTTEKSISKSSQELINSYELFGYAKDLKILLDTLELEKVYLTAHSTGSSISAIFLNLYPEKVEKAILTCSGIFKYDEKSFSAFHKVSRYVVMFRPKWLTKIPFMGRIVMKRFLYRSIPDNLCNEFLEDFIMADFDAAYGTVLTSVSKEASEWLPEQFKNSTVPILLVSGEYDKIIPAEMGEQAAKLNDKIEFFMMKNTAHFPMLEDPENYLRRVLTFLA
ncbi:alpha/beta hydrolase [Okeania sp.]|uniref:alpha/beta fold hydrolase n=1 Tax=Okeania sp. TaxID=3100323 RepID=UPI002B4B92E8|nr:alpha/beta hydrolase [Okeania sp.]MEB3342068.1 alpha/beta hydrolase [Okeania sp.]